MGSDLGLVVDWTSAPRRFIDNEISACLSGLPMTYHCETTAGNGTFISANKLPRTVAEMSVSVSFRVGRLQIMLGDFTVAEENR